MKEKVAGILNTRTRRIVAVTLCLAVLLSVGAVSAFATGAIPEFFHRQTLVKNEDGAITYSEDGGETWTEGAPEDFHIEHGEDGSTHTWVGEEPPPLDGDGQSLLVRNENGKTTYSTDGGETWTDEAPDGVTQTINPDGSFSVQNVNIRQDQ